MFILNVAEICIAVHKGTTIAKVDDGLSKALKHMPKKKRGPLFRVRTRACFCT